jgi:betaine lipid synthase
MSKYISVPEFFRAVYVVDLSPSLCEVAKARFQRLGWKNVKVVCQDARSFRLEEHEEDGDRTPALVVKEKNPYELNSAGEVGADLITLSFALSMIPEFYPVIDSLEMLLGPQGIIGVCDFYVQSQVDFRSKNYGGGVIDRHCNWWSRTFWRTWFEVRCGVVYDEEKANSESRLIA